jgi:manganese/zinc/iron transport system substrate-binding protein
MKRLWMLCALLAGLGVLGCARDAEPQPATEAGVDGPYTIVATVGMVEDTVRAVAGDRAEVIGLMGAGVDPHLYKPTRTDVQRLMGADVVFYNGLLLEGKMADALVRAATNGKKVHAVTELLDEDTLLEPEEFEGLYDPHVWMDPASWAKTVDVVRAKLSEFDPAGADAYAANADAYTAEVLGVDAYAERVLMTVPESARVLVTAHDAFNYFGRRFGYEVVAIQGLSTESEAGVRDIENPSSICSSNAVFVRCSLSRPCPNGTSAHSSPERRARGHTVASGASCSATRWATRGPTRARTSA